MVDPNPGPAKRADGLGYLGPGVSTAKSRLMQGQRGPTGDREDRWREAANSGCARCAVLHNMEDTASA